MYCNFPVAAAQCNENCPSLSQTSFLILKNALSLLYREAGEHLLTALNQQAAAKDVLGEKAPPKAMSDTIWSTLRLVLSLMHKFNLCEAIENR